MQIAQFIIVSRSVADELQTILIARNIVGVMGSRSGLRPLPNAWILATPTCTACNFGMEAWSGEGMPIEI